MKKLIVNADDFGFTMGVNTGIVRAYNDGIVTSATIMANGDAFDEAVEMARANPGLGVGIHLALVGGSPVSSVKAIPSLVDENGLLPRTLTRLFRMLVRRAVTTVDLVTELRAQVRRVVEAGITPTHFDSHKHSHIHPRVMRAISVVAREFNVSRIRNPFEGLLSPGAFGSAGQIKQAVLSAAILPGAIEFTRAARESRLKTPDHFCGVKLTGALDGAAIRRIMKSLKDGTTELMCHPGVYDSALERGHTRLKQERQSELTALCEPGLRDLAKQFDISLVSYREL